MSLLAVGTLAYDSIETATERRSDLLGGSATYFSLAASLFGGVSLVGVVGEDFRASDTELLRSRGIDLAGLEVAKGKTFRWAGRYEADWNTRHTLSTNLNVFEHFDPKVPLAQRGARFVFLANAAPEIQARALAQVTKPDFVMLDTMNLWIDIARPALLEVVRRVDALILNDEEARMLTGEKSLLRAANKALALGPRHIVLKKGEHGAFLIGPGAHFALPAYPVETVVDPTGAGDSFAGGFMGHLAAEAGTIGQVDAAALRRAMLHGTAAASFCVEGFGVERLARTSRAELDARSAELRAIVTV
jgi:sugar/nucleoside kinase (ribokinase family)